VLRRRGGDDAGWPPISKSQSLDQYLDIGITYFGQGKSISLVKHETASDTDK